MDFDSLFSEKRDIKKIFLVFILLIIGLIYIFDLFFGENSILYLMNLKRDVQILEKKVEKLKHENAILQKKYFELKELESG